MSFSQFFRQFDDIKQKHDLPSIRATLMTSVLCLMVFSLLMVASASIPYAVTKGVPELYYFWHQLMYMSIGVVAGVIIYYVPLKVINHRITQTIALVMVFILLFLTLWIGREVNGSKRWLDLGVLNFQVSELAKFVMIFVTASFVERRSHEVREGGWVGFFRIAIVLSFLALLLMFQPDFGSLVVIAGCVLAIFFVAGAPIKQFMTLGLIVVTLGVFGILFSKYRVSRVLSFVDPFDDIQDTDFQLARSLIAFGRGGWTGVGYGESVQKLSHLPEAHTDFLLAITGEELGFLGVFIILLLEAIVVSMAMLIGYQALKREHRRLSYICFGFAVLFIGQITINAGMNMGILPTKGLTMPFFSYGGSSMLVCLMMVGVLLKIDKESPSIPAKYRGKY